MSKLNDLVNSEKFYYPSLDGLRFFAFFIVFLHHALVGINSSNFIGEFFLSTIQKNGWVGVDLFFVLSGFLITSLLLQERKLFGSISVKKFWIRRALRIWPLYFLAVIFGFLIEPLVYPYLYPIDYANPSYQHELQSKSFFYLIFLGNWAVSSNGYSNFHTISHLWTISLEEQFYILLPLSLLLISNLKRSLIFGLLIILTSLITRSFLAYQNIQHPGIYTNTFARIDTLTLGSILALVLFFKPNLISLIKKITNSYFLSLIIFCFLIFLYKFYFFNPAQKLNVIFGFPIIALFITYFVIVALYNNSLKKFLSFKLFTYLGKISYGLYIWHIFAIDVTNSIFPTPKLLNVFFSFSLTIMISILTYNSFEKFFLRKKILFTRIKSKDI